MSAPVRKRGFLLNLAAEGMAGVVSGCAFALKAQRGIDLFGPPIVRCWMDWSRGQPPASSRTAIDELADLPLARARTEAIAEIERLVPQAAIEDRAVAIAYLTAIPRAAQRALVLDGATGSRTVPNGKGFESPQWSFNLLPLDVPPYLPGSALPGTPYTLTDFAGGSNLGVHFRATRADSDKAFLIKVCVDMSLVALLKQLPNRQVSGRWSEQLIRPLEQDLNHATPYLVFEHVSGGDLTMLEATLRHQTGRSLAGDEVFRLIEQIIEGLAFAHALGMVHGNLNPANVLVSGDALKLADVGVGVAVSEQSLRRGELFNEPAELVNLMRGSASWLYRAPEWKLGEPPDPRHDLYSLGVLWYQLLFGDVRGGLPDNWANPLNIPASQRSILERCLGPRDERPRDAQELLTLLRPGTAVVVAEQHPSIVSPEEVRCEHLRKQTLFTELKELRRRLHAYEEEKRRSRWITGSDLFWGFLPALTLGVLVVVLSNQIGMAVFSVIVDAAVIAMPVLFVIVMAAVISTRFRMRKRRVENTFDELLHRVNGLAKNHPDEVQNWGGESVLLNADLLPEIIAAFEEDLRTLSPELEKESG